VTSKLSKFTAAASYDILVVCGDFKVNRNLLRRFRMTFSGLR